MNLTGRKKFSWAIIPILSAAIIISLLFLTLFTPFFRSVGSIDETYSLTLPTEIIADGVTVFSPSSSSRVFYTDGTAELTSVARVPEDIPDRLDTILIRPYVGSFTLYADDQELLSFPEDRPYIDIGTDCFFSLRTGDLRGRELRLSVDVSGLHPVSGMRVNPIIITTDFGLTEILSPYVLLSLLFAGGGGVLILISVYIFFSVKDRRSRISIAAFMSIAVINVTGALSLYPSGLLLYNSSLFWHTVSSFTSAAIIISYITFIMAVTDGQILKTEVCTVISIGCLILFILYTLLSMAGFRSSFYAGHIYVLYRISSLIVILVGACNYHFRTKRCAYIVISSFMFLCAVFTNSFLSIAFELKVWQPTLVSLLRLFSVLIIVFETSSRHVTSQMNLIRENELERNAGLDPLSGCLTRRKFEDFLSSASLFKGKSLYVIYIDINGLKRINDCFGHQEGDRLIRYCGNVLKSFFPGEERIFRIGGDEFCVAGFDDGALQLSILIRDLKERFASDSPYSSTLSAGGLCVTVTDGDSLRDAVSRADDLMYRDKRGSRDERSILSRARMVSDVY